MIWPILAEWTGFLIRWTHVITAIAWIGSSFYFIHLDLSLKRHPEMASGIAGEAWQVHGGGFYRMRKYRVAPPEMPAKLTWFKWESYATWISGFFMLVWVYYLSADLYLIDPSVKAMPGWQAAAIGLGGIFGGWFAYDLMCRSPLGKNDVVLAAAGLVLIVFAAFAFTKVFGGRGAMLHTGAMIATWMSASVFVVIIPNQKRTVAALLAGQTPDPRLGAEAKQRSLHNNYLTLPVVFLMLSNHYPIVTQSRWNFVVVGLIVVAGGVIRHFFNEEHKGNPSPWWTWPAAATAIAVAAWLCVIGAPGTAQASAAERSYASVAQTAPPAIEAIQNRCTMCHAEYPAWPGMRIAPKGVRLETPDEIARHADDIRMQAVLTHAMPPGNVSEMTGDERLSVALWLAARDANRR